jgi:hypothetical protein
MEDIGVLSARKPAERDVTKRNKSETTFTTRSEAAHLVNVKSLVGFPRFADFPRFTQVTMLRA